jgi:hypothetical protein
MRRAIVLALVLLLASMSAVSAQETSEETLAQWADAHLCDYYEVTDKYLCFGFRAYWNQYGGLEIFGYPISNEMVVDGMTIQYFERARFEWHPGVWPERHDVLQGLLGVEVTAHLAGTGPFARATKAKDCVYFEETGHNVCDVFLKRWNMSGGLPVFGYPISEAFTEDGMLVQYFQRQRMEHQPGVWPERHDVLLGLLGVQVYKDVPAPPPPPPPPPGPEVEAIAENLVQPRHVTYTDHGVYVAEAGVGGDQCETVVVEFEGEEEEVELCVGLTGAVTKVHDGVQSRVVEGLPSIAVFGETGGPHDVAFDGDGKMHVVIGYGFELTPEVRDLFGEAGELLGTLIRVDGPGEFVVVADLLEYEFAENPDGSEHPDSNPYAITRAGADFIVVDAGGNSLLRVTQAGEISTIAIFPQRIVPAPPFIPVDEMPMDAVPTSVALGPDGNYYVGQLTGFPFPVGGARVYKVTPGGDVSVYAEGFTNIGAIAFDSQGRLVVQEIVAGGLLAADPDAVMQGDLSSVASRTVRVGADGSQTVLPIPGVFFATGLDIGANDELYIVHLSVTPFAQAVRVDLP